MNKKPWFAPNVPIPHPQPNNDLVVNANAPVVTVEVIIDFHFQPPKLAFKASQETPSSVLMQSLLAVCQTILVLQMQKEAKDAMVAAAEKPPDLPPAPPEKPS